MKQWAISLMCCISGLQYFCPRCLSRLPFSWRLLGAWPKHELEFILSGLPTLTIKFRDHRMAAAMALGFHCCFHGGEHFAIHDAEIFVNGTTGALLLPPIKKGIRDSVRIFDRQFSNILRGLNVVNPNHCFDRTKRLHI